MRRYPVVELRTVGILSPGEMGAAIGTVLTRGGLDVVTSLAGRSALTRLRASEAGIRDVGSVDEVVGSVDMLLSVLVPAEARSLAETVASSLQRTGARPLFVECNAIAPQTVLAIAEIVGKAVGGFIDAGIIGNPPRRAGDTTRFHCSGPDTAAFEALSRYGLQVRRVGPQVGQASGLKMVYAASTKGTTALWTELLVAARALGLEEALHAEFGPDHPIASRQMAGIPTMPRRARRWAGEMEEIAATFAHVGLTPRILEGAADMYRFIGDTSLGAQTSREPDPSLDTILGTLTDQLDARSP
jgi:3-hydroxyisobutyrate dehydrogenase-like beta-hydroxyacid dehydrogenase